MQATLRAPNLFITFFLILLAAVQPLLAAPIETNSDLQCGGSKQCAKEADNLKLQGAGTVKSKYTPRSVAAKKLKKRSQLAAELRKREILARARK
ncbi:hypothetical protein TWF730_005075 [Orbilia blumenaviensis]|uniref:Uncharacterized protein n=1 Tax=Orbilia blumenaviensis TaxID=1796055 RepID=A0AAV9VJH0_9PEZI